MNYIFKREDIDRENIFIHGRSLGGAVAIFAMTHFFKTKILYPFKIKGVILENTFTSIPDMVDKVFPLLKVFKRFILRNYWRSIELIPQSIPYFFNG